MDMENNNVDVHPGAGKVSWIACCLTLFISFSILKLMGMLVFPWWVVFAPIWIPLAVWGFEYVVFWLAVGYVWLIFYMMSKNKESN